MKENFECLDREWALKEITKLMPDMEDSFLNDLIDDLKRKPAICRGEQRDLVVNIRPGLDQYDILAIQQIENAIDKAIGPLGLTRSKSSKHGHKVEFVYWRFGEKKCKLI